jgi:hypothetical protein
LLIFFAIVPFLEAGYSRTYGNRCFDCGDISRQRQTQQGPASMQPVGRSSDRAIYGMPGGFQARQSW